MTREHVPTDGRNQAGDGELRRRVFVVVFQSRTLVTLTTVGFGDIVPQTTLGQVVASIVMIMGYGIIAVPTGIYAAELREVMTRRRTLRKCPECSRTGHDEDARFCKFCGATFRTEPAA